MCGHARYSRWVRSRLDEMEEMITLYLLAAILGKAAAQRGRLPIDETIIDAHCNSQTRCAKPAILRKNGYQLYYITQSTNTRTEIRPVICQCRHGNKHSRYYPCYRAQT